MNEKESTHLNMEIKMGPDLVLEEMIMETESVTEMQAETEGGTEIQAETEGGTEIQAETETGTEIQAETETGTEIQAETETGTEIQAETEGGTEIQAETEGGTGIQAETDGGTEIQGETEGGTKMQAETEGGTGIQAETDGGTEIQGETEGGTKMQAETETGIEVQAETETGTEIQAETQGATEIQTETEGGTEIQGETEGVTEIQTETEGGTVIQAETEIETEIQAETEAGMEKQTETEIETEIETVTETEIETEAETEKVTTIDIPEPVVSEPQEQLEGNPDVYTDSVKEGEVITIVTQENEGEIYIYEGNETDAVQNENTCNFIEVVDSNKDFESVSNCESKEDTSVEITVDEIEEKEPEAEVEEEVVEESSECKNGESIDMIMETHEENGEVENDSKEIEVCELVDDKVSESVEGKNYKNVILEDWDVEVPPLVENHESENCMETIVIAEEPQESQIIETQEETPYSNENCTVMEVTEENEVVHENKDQEKEENENSVSEPPKENSTTTELEGEILKLMSEKKVDSLKYSKTITKNDIVKILDESTERVVRPIVTKKDLFFSIELTKRLNQKLSLSKSLRNSEPGDKNNVTNESESYNNNNMVDDRQKIVDILEADEVKDWKSVPSKSDANLRENGNDMEISNAIKSMVEGDSTGKRPAPKTPKKTPKKFRTMDKELERTLALQQLRDEFPSTRKRSRTSKKVNHVPFLASTVLEKALTSPEVTTALKPGPPKRRPCYLPDNVSYSKGNEAIKMDGHGETSSSTPDNRIKKVKIKNDGQSMRDRNLVEVKAKSGGNVMDIGVEGSSNSCISNPIVKTYSVKRKSTDTENNIKTTLETIAAVTKALNESAEESIEPTPKKQKTVPKPDVKMKKKVLVKKKAKLKGKAVSAGEKKRNLELEKLLGDEGAVRMLYETQHGENSSSTPKKTKTKTTSGLKKDLVLKTKLVKNAVMRLSGVGSEGVFLRGKRRSAKPKTEDHVNEEEDSAEPLFSSTPTIVLYKPKKKQRAEASRILYRHSSSESFDSSEGYRGASFEADGPSAKEGPKLNGEKSEESSLPAAETEKVSPKVIKAKKSELVVRKRFQKLKNPKSLTQRKEIKVTKSKRRSERTSTDSVSVADSKINLSIVPVRKSSRPRMVSKKYSIWSSTSMDSLSVGLKKLKKASTELGKKLNCKELTILQYEHLVQVVLSPSSTLMKNSLNQEVLQELKQVFRFLSDDESCRVVLLSSTGNTFCQGIDLNQILTFSESERRNGVVALTNAISELIKCLTEFKKPLIAGVHAAAVGLGVTLLPYCDLVICSDKTSFYTPYVKLGQAPEGAPTHTFPRISRQLVSELLFKSHKMTATDALKHGLVTQIIPEDRFEEEVIIMARNIAAQPSQGIQSIKFLLRNSDRDEIAQALQLEGDLLAEHWTSSECLNNIIRFLNSGEVQLKQLDNT